LCLIATRHEPKGCDREQILNLLLNPPGSPVEKADAESTQYVRAQDGRSALFLAARAGKRLSRRTQMSKKISTLLIIKDIFY
jgi:hypothetical protein